VLDLGAERRRFRHDAAVGFRGLSSEWYNLLASMGGRRVGPSSEQTFALPENPRVLARAAGALLRLGGQVDETIEQTAPLMQNAMFQWQSWKTMTASSETPTDWELWLQQSKRVDYLRNSGTAGTADEQFYASLYRFIERHKAPPVVRDVVTFRHGLAGWNFTQAAAAGERLIPMASAKRGWIAGDELRDGLVIARLHLGDTPGARQAHDSLARYSRRPATDLRSRLLTAYVEAAEKNHRVAVRP
jgi:hypothetical protein